MPYFLEKAGTACACATAPSAGHKPNIFWLNGGSTQAAARTASANTAVNRPLL